jgi:hypothetical protein
MSKQNEGLRGFFRSARSRWDLGWSAGDTRGRKGLDASTLNDTYEDSDNRQNQQDVNEATEGVGTYHS